MTTAIATAVAQASDTGDTEPVSWQPEVLVKKKWTANSLRFATKKEAESNAHATFLSWAATQDWRAMPSSDPVAHRWIDGRLIAIEEAERLVLRR